MLNEILSSFDVTGQALLVKNGVGYFMADVDKEVSLSIHPDSEFTLKASQEVSDRLQALPTNIRTRILY